MFCFYCGKEIDDGLVYCPFCGKRVDQPEEDISDESFEEEGLAEEAATEDMPYELTQQPYEDEAFAYEDERFEARNDAFVNERYEREKNWEMQKMAPKKKVKASTIVIIILCVLLAAGGGIGAYLFLGNQGGEEVDLQTLIDGPTVSGFDGFAEMDKEIGVDEAKMEAYLGTIKNDERRSAVKGVLLTVKYKPDKHQKLKNGDVVTITAEYDKDMAESIELAVLNDSFEYTVDGLEEGEDVAYNPDLCHHDADTFIFPLSDQEYLTPEDIFYATSDDEDLIQRGINEIYARHGMIFESSYYKQMFRNCRWYTPTYKKDEIKSSWLNKYETTNIQTLADYRSNVRDYNSTVHCSLCGKAIKKGEAFVYDDKYYCGDCYGMVLYDLEDEEYYEEEYNDLSYDD